MEHKVTCVLMLVLMLALSSLAQDQAEPCTVAPHHRNNCGYPGVTAAECKKKGCCFDDTIRGVPWCFKPNTAENPLEEECPF